MKKTVLFALKGIFLVLMLSGGVFLSCEIDPEGNSSDSEVQESVVWSGNTSFTDWSQSIQIAKDKFSDFSAGSKIIVQAEAVSADYHKLKFYCAADSGWLELKDGSYSGGKYDNEHGGVEPSESFVSYTVTADDAQCLKEHGFALNGYGVAVTKITLLFSRETAETPSVTSGTPFANHGKLRVEGARLLDEHGTQYQLYGMSTHGINFGTDMSRYVNKDAFKTLRDDWNTNCIRLVLYPKDYNGYCNGGNQAELKKIMCDGIEYAAQLGMYVLVDWHVHDYNPQETQAQAIAFLGEISAKYANYGNVLYEICNEPTGSPWSTAIKPYAQAVIPAIRKNAPDAVIIVGTNTWSQDLDEAWADKLDFKNVMYTFHFYADTHKDSFRERVKNTVGRGMPVFITEFGTCDASGNGGFNAAESNSWFDLMKEYGISHCNWSLCNKSETASAIVPGCSKVSGWAEGDLTESGRLVRSHFRSLSR